MTVQEEERNYQEDNVKNSKGNYRAITDFILIVLLISVIVLVAVDMFRVANAKSECLGNPISYGIGKWEEVNNAEFTCTCSFGVKDSPILIFTDEGFTQKEAERTDIFPFQTTNYSSLINITK